MIIMKGLKRKNIKLKVNSRNLRIVLLFTCMKKATYSMLTSSGKESNSNMAGEHIPQKINKIHQIQS